MLLKQKRSQHNVKTFQNSGSVAVHNSSDFMEELIEIAGFLIFYENSNNQSELAKN